MTRTAFGSPLVPEVKIIMKVSVGLDLAMRNQRPGCCQQTSPLIACDVDDADAGQIQPVEQCAVRRVGEQYLAVGPHDVFGQRRAATGVVDAAQHVAAERRGRHRGQHFGGVAQQRAHMQGAFRVGDADQCGGRGRGVRQVLAPTPHPVAVFHRRRGVANAGAQQLLNSLRHRLGRYRRSVSCLGGRAMFVDGGDVLTGQSLSMPGVVLDT